MVGIRRVVAGRVLSGLQLANPVVWAFRLRLAPDQVLALSEQFFRIQLRPLQRAGKYRYHLVTGVAWVDRLTKATPPPSKCRGVRCSLCGVIFLPLNTRVVRGSTRKPAAMVRIASSRKVRDSDDMLGAGADRKFRRSHAPVQVFLVALVVVGTLAACGGPVAAGHPSSKPPSPAPTGGVAVTAPSSPTATAAPNASPTPTPIVSVAGGVAAQRIALEFCQAYYAGNKSVRYYLTPAAAATWNPPLPDPGATISAPHPPLTARQQMAPLPSPFSP